MIRHNNILVGHCVLIPGRKAEGTSHITNGQEYVRLCFFLSSIHRRRGVLFAALRSVLQIAVKDFDVTMVYAKADTSNTAAKSLLYKLMDWSEAQWGGLGTTSDSTIRIAHRASLNRDDGPSEIEVRPATQFCWPIGVFSPKTFPNIFKPMDNYKRTTWHSKWREQLDSKKAAQKDCIADAVRDTPWDPTDVISDASFRDTRPSKSTKGEERQ